VSSVIVRAKVLTRRTPRDIIAVRRRPGNFCLKGAQACACLKPRFSSRYS